MFKFIEMEEAGTESGPTESNELRSGSGFWERALVEKHGVATVVFFGWVFNTKPWGISNK